ncbi:TetR/AcrR family transcriptional regulator [Paraburkholderia silvatlantica]|uniref:TetR/AcrR family transcriptional regulator n=1 Tax=Paraburkholderia silvatlantica TaxID=321895 RepID=UPI003750B2C8
MRVSRAQAEENRRVVIEKAGQLFRERGFDGVGLNDLMGAAGLTQGGFYKQFRSKEDLAVQACDRVMADSKAHLTQVVESGTEDPLAEIVSQYLSRRHRDMPGGGCIFASLGADAARGSPELIRSFEAGIRGYLEILEHAAQTSPVHGPPQDPAVMLSTMVGALVLSRLVADTTLSDRILDTAIGSLLDRRGSADPEVR